MRDLQTRVGEWHRKRFSEAGMSHVGLKAAEEVGEVATAINDVIWTGDGNVAEEAADVVIALMALLHRWFPEKDLMEEVEKKLAILMDPNSGHKAAAWKEDNE